MVGVGARRVQPPNLRRWASHIRLQGTPDILHLRLRGAHRRGERLVLGGAHRQCQRQRQQGHLAGAVGGKGARWNFGSKEKGISEFLNFLEC